MLGVHMQHFQNLYNAEFRSSGKYCCCDISYLDVPCVENLTDLNVTACTSECEPYFEMYFEVCLADGTCSQMEKEIACILSNISSTCMSVIDNITNVSESKVSFKLSFTDMRCCLSKVLT